MYDSKTFHKSSAWLFIAIFVINAVFNPLWALYAYPLIGLLVWIHSQLIGFQVPFWKTVFLWLPITWKNIMTPDV